MSALISFRRTGRARLLPAAVSVGLLVLGVSACGGSSDSNSPGASGSAEAGSPAALLPEDIKKSGTLMAATDGTYPPNEFKEGGGPLQGFDIDLANAVAKQLGVTIEFDDAKFDSLLTGIQGGRYDLAFSSMTDNKDREKKVDFVDYFNAGTSILVKKGNPENITQLTDLCGKPVALEQGTVQVDIAKNADCPAGQPIQVTALPDDASARQQVLGGRAVADMNDFPVAEYTAKTSGGGNDFEVVGQQYETAPYGIAVSKDIDGLTKAVQAALKAVIASGEYDKILATWDVSAGALKTAQINGAS